MTSPASRPPHRLIFGLAIVLGAFLLFQVQPMAGKAILPWFGGTAAVWITCLLFFQVGLLLGTVYAHGLMRFLRPGAQAAVHCGLLLAALAVLPINPSITWKPVDTAEPTLRILGLLSVSLGLPYFLLGATSPLLQAWYARTHAEGVPWRFFALSNVGSLVALVSYPFAVEPFLGVRLQMHVWSGAFAVFAVLCGTVAILSARAVALPTARTETPPVPPPAGLDRASWVLLSACGSVLLMAISHHVTQNVGAIPFLWVLPLSIYLVTFILCFEGSGWYRRGTFLPMLFLCVWAVIGFMGSGVEAATLWITLPVFFTTLFVACMVCHGELALLRPDASRLTSFYLGMSLGGALGGVFAGVVAPRIFSGFWELPVGLAAVVVLALAAVWRRRPPKFSASLFKPLWTMAAIAGVLTCVALGAQVHALKSTHRVMVRDFYGALRVRDRQGPAGNVRMLLHGIISHGEQFTDPDRRRLPASYFADWSGGALAITSQPRPARQKVGIVGLGTGTLAAWGRAGDEYRFYEINPLIVDLARTEFTYLADSAAHVDVVLGDARLTLEREPGQQFDVIVIDAFSGDSIPTHLLTREAFQVYRRHLKPDGMLAMHITNRYLDLAPIVAQGAADLGWSAFQVKSLPDEKRAWRASTWVLVSLRPIEIPMSREFNEGKAIILEPGKRPWTDDFSDLLGVLK